MGKPKKFLVGGLLNLGYGLATAGASYAQQRKALRQLGQLGQMEDGNIMSLAARRRVARQESDAQSAIDEAARASASSLAAAQEAGGFRGVQSISPSVARAQEEAVARSLQQFGEYGARAAEQENSDLIMSRQARLAEQRSGLQAAADMATQNMVQGLGLAAGGLAQTIGGIGPRQKKEPKSPGLDTGAIKSAAESTKQMEGLAGAQLSAIRQQLNKPFDRPALGLSRAVGSAKQMQDLSGSQLSEIQQQSSDIPGVGKPFARPSIGLLSDEERAKMLQQSYAKGGKAMKTPGKFSHEANPIDVIKDGKKIAEMTGGEYIFNPKQSEQMRNLSEKGNTALHKFVRDLLSKRQFK